MTASIANTRLSQAASAIENFKIESPVKKLDFGAADKENQPIDAGVTDLAKSMDAKQADKPIALEVAKQEEAPKAPGLSAEELEEPILKENPHRFVLFPIQYHEVRDATCPSDA